MLKHVIAHIALAYFMVACAFMPVLHRVSRAIGPVTIEVAHAR